MSHHEKDSLDCLFSRQDRKLINIKFMRGDAKVISTEDFRDAVRSMVHQSGTVEAGPARSGREQVQLRNFVANL